MSDRERAEQLQRELTGTQEMLAFVLDSIGEPVVVKKERLVQGLPKGIQIVVDDDQAAEVFRFYLAEPK